MFYDLAASSWDHEEIEAIEKVIASDRYTIGANVAAFEEEFAAYHGKRFGVMTNSGSSANLIAVAALSFKADRPLTRGDEVIVPAISWATTYHPLHQYGLRMKIVYVDLATLNIDVQQLERALSDRTQMICAVSILGNPARLDVMREFSDRNGIYFMEDNCESLDAELAGRKTGTFGDLATYSFFFSHHISTMEGGMVITDDEELCHLLKSLRARGWTRDLPNASPVFDRKNTDFYEAYRFILPGYNVRPTEISAAVGRVQLRKLPDMTAQRRKNWSLFQSLFAGDPRFTIQEETGKSSAFAFTIVLNSDLNPDRERVFAAMDEADIGFRIITGGCITRHDVCRFFDFDTVGSLNNAEMAHDYGFFVGNHPHDLTPQIEQLHTVLDRTC